MDKKAFDKRIEAAMAEIAAQVTADYGNGRDIDNTDELYCLPDKDSIIDIKIGRAHV